MTVQRDDKMDSEKIRMMNRTMASRIAIVLVAVGCAWTMPGMAATAGDPWEKVNRPVFSFNDWTDRHVLRPVAKGYTKVVPRFLRRGIGNVFDNLGTPAVAINQLLQGKPGRSLSDTGRFLVNTTLGLGGVFDVATEVGLAEHQEDFGQTFGVWGIGSGNYVVLPFRGSANVRDTVGIVLDTVFNPLRFISPVESRTAVVALSVVDLRAELLSVDQLVVGERYVFFRDAYAQRRDFLIRDGVYDEDPFADDGFGDDDF